MHGPTEQEHICQDRHKVCQVIDCPLCTSVLTFFTLLCSIRNTYTAELIIELNAVVDPKYMQPRRATMTLTHSCALNGEPNLGLTRAHTLDKGKPSSRAKAQNIRPVPVEVRRRIIFDNKKAILTQLGTDNARPKGDPYHEHQAKGSTSCRGCLPKEFGERKSSVCVSQAAIVLN